MGKSALGAGIKAGGPNYVAQFMAFTEQAPPPVMPIRHEHALLRLAQEWKRKIDSGGLAEYAEDLKKTARAIKSYLYHFEEEFSREKDYFHLRGQDNTVRYLPVGTVVVRVHEDDSLWQVLARMAAVQIAGCELIVSFPPGPDNATAAFLDRGEFAQLRGEAPVMRQSDEDLVEMMPKVQRVRYAGEDRVPPEVLRAAAETGFYIARAQVAMEGRIELLHYFREQSICNNYHRYGNLGERM